MNRYSAIHHSRAEHGSPAGDPATYSSYEELS
jgi:hypothetical protein